MKKYYIDTKNQGIRIDKYLVNILGNIPRTFISKNIHEVVLVNLKNVKPSYKLKEGDEISLDTEALDKKYEQENIRLNMESNIIKQKGTLDIYYENADYLILKKEHGVVVHPGVGNESETLANFVLNYLHEKKETDLELKRAGIVHRLDKGVGGLMVFAKKRKHQKFFSEQFEKHEVLKIYYAESKNDCFTEYFDSSGVEGVIGDFSQGNDINLSNWQKVEGVITRDSSNRKRMVFYRNVFDKKYRYALSYILPITKNSMFVLIKTGRTHQIRATLKSLGIVLKGDRLYGWTGSETEHIGLKSVVLGFKELNGEKKIFKIHKELKYGQEF